MSEIEALSKPSMPILSASLVARFREVSMRDAVETATESASVPTIMEVMEGEAYFQAWFAKPSWEPWKAFLCGLFGLPMSPDREVLWREFTQRSTIPDEPAKEAWLVCGRRAGKS